MEANLIPEIEKLIAKYQERVKRYEEMAQRHVASTRMGSFIARDESLIRAGAFTQIIDDLKHLAGIE